MHGTSTHDLDDEGAWMSAVNDDDDDDDEDSVPLPPTFLQFNDDNPISALTSPPAISPPDTVLSPPVTQSPSRSALLRNEAAQSFLRDPYATAAITLALTTIQNEMNVDGFAAETLIELEEDAESPLPPPANPSSPPASSHLQSVQHLADAALHPNPKWPSNVISTVPGLPLYNLGP